MTESIEMEVSDVTHEKLIDIPLKTNEQLKLTKDQLKKSYNISKNTITFIQKTLEILSQRNTFKIDEYKIVGSFYETLSEMNEETITGDSIQGLLNILQTASKRGTFLLNEFEIIADLCRSIRNVIE